MASPRSRVCILCVCVCVYVLWVIQERVSLRSSRVTVTAHRAGAACL